MSRHATQTATPRPNLSSLTPMSNHKTNGIRAHNDRHTITNDPDNLHAMSNHNQNAPPQGAHTDRNTITPPGVGIFLLSRG